MGVASLVLGIVAIIISFIPCLGIYALVPSIIGLLLGLFGIISACKANPPKGKGLAIAGFVLSIIATIVAGWQYHVLSQAVDESSEFGKAMSNLAKAIDDASKKATEAAAQAQKEADKQQKQ